MKKPRKRNITLNHLYTTMMRGFAGIDAKLDARFSEFAVLVNQGFTAKREETNKQFGVVYGRLDRIENTQTQFSKDLTRLSDSMQRTERKIDNVLIHRWEFDTLEGRVSTLEKKGK